MSCLFLSEHWCVAECFLCLEGIPKLFSVEEGSDMAGESFFAISGNVSTYQVCKTRAKWIFSKHHSKSLEASWLQKIFNSMNRHQPQCWLRKAALAYFQMRPLLQLQEQLQCAASCSLSSDSLHGVAITPKPLQTCSVFWEISEGAWETLLFHIRDKQHIACEYNQGKNCQFTNSAPKNLEASWFNW